VLLRVLTVCTGNVCRSPLAQLFLAARLSGSDVGVESAGTRARVGMKPPSEIMSVASSHGLDAVHLEKHAAQLLTSRQLSSADLVLAMSREHRRAVVELEPSLVRRTFTVREFSRLLHDLTDSDLRLAARGLSEPPARLFAMLTLAASRRGIAPPPGDPESDDVVDPFGRSARTYSRFTEQLFSALPSAERVLRLALD